MIDDLLIQPAARAWADADGATPDRPLLGTTLGQWQVRTRRELGITTDRAVIATGHQALLWHPGILSKYLAVAAAAGAHGLAAANLIVDQHADGFGAFDLPRRRPDGGLAVMQVRLVTERRGVPMCLHEPFTPPPLPRFDAALPSVARGAQAIVEAVAAHRRAPSAALQMAGALADLMGRWVEPMPSATASALARTALARALLERMVDEPRECAEAYNRAVVSVPEAGIGPLHVGHDTVELPLWRIGPDQRRRRASDHDVAAWLEGADDVGALLPRALFLTALVRLGMCDLFVHGTGGARYDRAMERWIRWWLGVEPASRAVVTATLRLPLDLGDDDGQGALSLAAALTAERRLRHDPESAGTPPPGPGPGPVKRAMLHAIDGAARRSVRRRQRFQEMHDRLEVLLASHDEAAQAAAEHTRRARLARRQRAIAQRRTWPFPLYETEALDALAAAITAEFAAERARALLRGS